MTLTAGALVAFLSAFGALQDDNLQPALKRFRDDYYKNGANEDDKIAAVNYLARNRHETVVKTLAPLLTEASIPVRVMVARSFSQFHNIETAARELLGALTAQANSGRKTSCVRIEVLRSLGALRYKPAGAGVARMVEEKEVWVAKAAIDASANIRIADAVVPLIKALHRIEGKEGDAEISVDPLDIIEGVDAGSLFRKDPREPKRPNQRQLLRDPILGALRKITNQSFASAKDWDAWWSKNKQTFRVPE